MNIRGKLLAIVAASIALGLIVIYYSVSSIMLKSFLDIENRYADNSIGGVARSFVQICEDFSNKMNDWATWDDSYNFMFDKNRRFIESNITYESMNSLGLDFLFFVGSSNEIVLDCSFDHVNKRINSAGASIKKSVIDFAGSMASATQKTSMAGLFSLESKPALIASNLILTSTGAGPARGYIIYGHYIDNGEIERISKLSGLSLTYEKVEDHDKSHSEVIQDFNAAGLKYSCGKLITPELISCLLTVNCVAGRPLFTVKFSEPRMIYNQAVATVGYFILALLVSGAVFFILAIYLIDRFFAQRIVKLSAEVKGISLENNSHRRVSKNGTDEISVLASEINMLLENIEGSNKEMKKLVAELDAAARAKSDFIGNIGHELRTPITCIIGYADILSEIVPEGEPREFVNRLKLSAHMLISTVNDILDHISLEGGELKLNSGEFNFSEVFNEIIGYAKFIAEEKKLVFNARIDEKLSGMKVIGDQTRLKQVVLNLAGNALKFTSAGFIEIGADISGETEKEVEVMVSVKDSGIGVSDEKRAEIFLPFVQGDNSSTRKYGGSGLGLTIAGNLVMLMGGEKINLESRAGEGSNFYFNVKLIKA
jgi:signal transduction histidine kinase